MLLHRKGRARRLVHDSRRGGMMVVMMYDYWGRRSGRRCRDYLLDVFVAPALTDRIEPYPVRPRQEQQIRDPVPARRGVSRLGPRVHLDLCGKQVSQVIQ